MSVIQSDDLELSEATLAALKLFAAESDLGIDFDAQDVREQVQAAMDTHPREETFEFTFGNDIKIQLRGVSAELGQTLQSTGLTVWLASRQLADYLWQTRTSLKGMRMIELGAGLGLCGVLASQLCGSNGSVVLTDGGEEFTTDAQKVLQEQVDRNHNSKSSSCAVEPLTWGEHADFIERHTPPPFDLILAADVLYEAEAVDPFFDTVAALLALNPSAAKLLLGYVHRNVSIDKVWEAATSRGLHWRVADGFVPELSTVQIYEVTLRTSSSSNNTTTSSSSSNSSSNAAAAVR